MMNALVRISAFTLLALGVAACGGDEPIDFEGTYTINVTNRDNGCNLDNWTEGDTTSNIGVVITQDGSDVSAEVQGLVGSYLSLVLGSQIFEGEGSGNDLDLTLFGTRSATQGNCTYTMNARLEGSLAGDVLQGRLIYEAATNDNPDCAELEGCQTFQDFNGTRPPS